MTQPPSPGAAPTPTRATGADSVPAATKVTTRPVASVAREPRTTCETARPTSGDAVSVAGAPTKEGRDSGVDAATKEGRDLCGAWPNPRGAAAGAGEAVRPSSLGDATAGVASGAEGAGARTITEGSCGGASSARACLVPDTVRPASRTAATFIDLANRMGHSRSKLRAIAGGLSARARPA